MFGIEEHKIMIKDFEDQNSGLCEGYRLSNQIGNSEENYRMAISESNNNEVTSVNKGQIKTNNKGQKSGNKRNATGGGGGAKERFFLKIPRVVFNQRQRFDSEEVFRYVKNYNRKVKLFLAENAQYSDCLFYPKI